MCQEIYQRAQYACGHYGHMQYLETEHCGRGEKHGPCSYPDGVEMFTEDFHSHSYCDGCAEEEEKRAKRAKRERRERREQQLQVMDLRRNEQAVAHRHDSHDSHHSHHSGSSLQVASSGTKGQKQVMAQGSVRMSSLSMSFAVGFSKPSSSSG